MSDSEPTMDLWPPATRSRGRCPAVLAHPPPVGLLRSSALDHDLGPLGAKSLAASSESLISSLPLLPEARHRGRPEPIPEWQSLAPTVEKESGSELGAAQVAQHSEAPEVLGRDRGGCLRLDSGHPAVWRFQDRIHLHSVLGS